MGPETARARRRSSGARFSVVLFIVVGLMSLGVGLTLAAPPFTVSIDEPIAVSGHTVTLNGTADSPSSADHHIVIEWGDGEDDTLPEFSDDAPWTWGPLDHTYAAEGTYTITVTLIHSEDEGNDRGTATDSAQVVIAPAPCTVNCSPTEPPAVPPTEVKAEVFKRPAKLAKTGPGETSTALTVMGLVFLLAGATLHLLSFNDSEELERA